VTHERPPWETLERRGRDSIEIAGRRVRAGSRVRLAPRAGGGDVFELALAGRAATVEEVLEDYDGRLQLAVTVSDDPGRDLGRLRRPGHRFFFAPGEVEPLDEVPAGSRDDAGAPGRCGDPDTRVLVAGVGNVFLGDDGWGVALAARLAEREQPPGVEVADFGIRGMDLAYAIQDGYDAVVLLDATPRGRAPGTLYVIEPDLQDVQGPLDAHGMDPVRVLALARTLGARRLPRMLVVGCEPRAAVDPADEQILVELSAPVQASLEQAVAVVEQLLGDLTTTTERQEECPP
jgi:hydrogenase maturation protease